MKSLALMLALALQLTGLWAHLPASTRQHLANQAVGSPPAAAAPATTSAIISPALPIHLGTEPFAPDPHTSVLALDRTTAAPLFAQNATKQRPIASVTKMITTLVILSRHSPTELVTIAKLPAYTSDDDTIGLQPGETYRLGDLVRAALIPSANDAADTLALYDSGSTTKFAAQMNLKLAAWGITGAHFTNPSGLQDTGNYATAEALGKVALLALQNPFIAQTVRQSSVSFTSTAGRTLTATSTNDLLATGQFYGIKTGYTLAAGECFVGLAHLDGHDVITVVLGSSDRFGETQTLVNWIKRNYQWL
ncbi:MAG TPA: hypothetical protein VLI05_03990 [Candidatus Saccharimonadia bacterium]|nr:hypothetical protein [Candidatus Saccharimonadia bacterium]